MVFIFWGLSQSFCFDFDLALVTSAASWAGIDTTLTSFGPCNWEVEAQSITAL